MPAQYQGFTNPTIIPDRPMGWQAASDATGDAIKQISGYAISQQQKIQDLQLQQAQDLSKFKTLDQVYYGGSHGQQLDQLLSQNPYGRHLITRNPSSMGSATQDSSPFAGGNMNIGGAMIGAPGAGSFGVGALPTNSSPQASGASPSASMSPLNPVNGPVSTGGSMTAGGMEPPKFSQSFMNPAGEAQVQSAKTGAEKMAEEQAGAQAGVSKDAQQLAMITNAIKPLAESYDKVYGSSAMGLPAAGDIYGSSIVKNADMIPRFAQSSIVNPETQQAAGQFLANKNELVTKLQPLLSQQFGKDGSSRIMESLLNMSQNEIGDLNTPRDQFHGQITGTISSLYRIAKAAQAYKQDLQASGASNPTPDQASQEIIKRMQLQKIGPEEQKELQGMIDETLGNRAPSGTSGSFGGSMNPVSNAKQPAQQGKPQAPSGAAAQFSRQQILEELNRRKNLRDIQSNISQ